MINSSKPARYHRQQNKCYPQKSVRLPEKMQHSVMKFDRSNKFDFCNYGQVNSIRQTRVLLRNGQVEIYGVTFILLVIVHFSSDYNAFNIDSGFLYRHCRS